MTQSTLASRIEMLQRSLASEKDGDRRATLQRKLVEAQRWLQAAKRIS